MKHGLLRIVSTPQKSTARGFFPRGRTSARPHLGFFGRIAMPLLARLSATLSAAVWQAGLSLDDSLASWGTSGLGGVMISLVRDISLKEVGMNTSSRWVILRSILVFPAWSGLRSRGNALRRFAGPEVPLCRPSEPDVQMSRLQAVLHLSAVRTSDAS